MEDGAVVGVKAENNHDQFDVRGNAVILATGGLGHNEELQRRYLPEIAAARSRVNVISVAGTTGDGILMAQAAGAALVGMDQGAFMLEPSFAPALGTPPWLIFVNQHGQRFIREDAPHPAMNEVAIMQENGMVWAICDDPARAGGWADIEPYTADRRVVRADTLTELADKLGISALFKASDFLKPIETGPFYGIPLVLATVGVPTGGVLGRYPSSGAAITDAIVFGKIAGEQAATH